MSPKLEMLENQQSFPDNSDDDLSDPKGLPQALVPLGAPATSSALVPSVTSMVPSSKRGRVDDPTEDPTKMMRKSPPRKNIRKQSLV